jgi:hypothetical protein
VAPVVEDPQAPAEIGFSIQSMNIITIAVATIPDTSPRFADLPRCRDEIGQSANSQNQKDPRRPHQFEGLATHRKAVVLAGAQEIQLHVGEGDLGWVAVHGR